LEYSAKALEEKLLHKKEIKYLSFGSESALIGASLTDESLGKIVIANNQASNIFNYSKQEISKIALNSIMPKLYAEQHDHYLLEFQKNKYKRINSDERLLFGKDKHGFVIPILLQLQRTISSIS
jgi:PAS domain S-box-containing protein